MVKRSRWGDSDEIYRSCQGRCLLKPANTRVKTEAPITHTFKSSSYSDMTSSWPGCIGLLLLTGIFLPGTAGRSRVLNPGPFLAIQGHSQPASPWPKQNLPGYASQRSANMRAVVGTT